MKRLLLAISLVFGIACGSMAQSEGIQFEQSKEWKKILKQARKEKKLIFVDCYTSWCGPCKMLAREVFTKEEVGNYFNQAFVNTKFDMEKDADGVMLKDLFAIKAYPTLVFVDPVTQQVVHKIVGAGSPEWLLKGAKTANDPQNNLSAMMKRYAEGEREPAFLGRYLEVLAGAYMAEEQGKVAVGYLDALSVDQLATPENWELINKYISDPLSGPLKKVMANRDKFYVVAGKEVVEDKLERSIAAATGMLAHWRPGMETSFDEQQNTRLVEYLLSVDHPAAPAALAQLYTAACIRKGDFRAMLDQMRQALSYNVFRNGSERYYFQNSIEALALCEDKALVEEGIRWIDQRCAHTEDYFGKADLMNSKARLQTKIGDSLGANESKMQEEKYNKEGEKRSGGRVFRAIRMN